MRLEESELLKLRPPDLEVKDGLLRMLGGEGKRKCIRVYLTMKRGPCHDDWCEPIRKAAALISENTDHSRGEILLSVNGVCVVIDGELYYSASKWRDKITLDAGKSGVVRVRGFTAY